MNVGFAYHVTIFTKSLLSLVDFIRQDGVMAKSDPGPDAPRFRRPAASHRRASRCRISS